MGENPPPLHLHNTPPRGAQHQARSNTPRKFLSSLSLLFCVAAAPACLRSATALWLSCDLVRSGASPNGLEQSQPWRGMRRRWVAAATDQVICPPITQRVCVWALSVGVVGGWWWWVWWGVGIVESNQPRHPTLAWPGQGICVVSPTEHVPCRQRQRGSAAASGTTPAQINSAHTGTGGPDVLWSPARPVMSKDDSWKRDARLATRRGAVRIAACTICHPARHEAIGQSKAATAASMRDWSQRPAPTRSALLGKETAVKLTPPSSSSKS